MVLCNERRGGWAHCEVDVLKKGEESVFEGLGGLAVDFLNLKSQITDQFLLAPAAHASTSAVSVFRHNSHTPLYHCGGCDSSHRNKMLLLLRRPLSHHVSRTTSSGLLQHASSSTHPYALHIGTCSTTTSSRRRRHTSVIAAVTTSSSGADGDDNDEADDGTAPVQPGKPLRVERLLANLGYGKRKECTSMIKRRQLVYVATGLPAKVRVAAGNRHGAAQLVSVQDTCLIGRFAHLTAICVPTC